MKLTGLNGLKCCITASSILFFLNLISISIFGNDVRDNSIPTPKVFKAIGIKPGMVIGEPGAGEGYFTFKLSKEVGPQGKIYANDIDDEMLDILKKEIRKKDIKNVITIKGIETDPLFPEDEMDMIFMSYVLHHIEEPVKFLKNLKRSFKKDATLVILAADPDKHSSVRGHFLEKKVLMKIVEDAGYKLVRIETFLIYDNIYIYKL
jgi:ubiquinone/menaquinone biosynthesis C-methylase UbiE